MIRKIQDSLVGPLSAAGAEAMEVGRREPRAPKASDGELEPVAPGNDRGPLTGSAPERPRGVDPHLEGTSAPDGGTELAGERPLNSGVYEQAAAIDKYGLGGHRHAAKAAQSGPGFGLDSALVSDDWAPVDPALTGISIEDALAELTTGSTPDEQTSQQAAPTPTQQVRH
ncbi:MAG: hypothetical protein HYV63_03285 [Candidatus Schekmanbacteria bacterium]|nr:hypothetical protein [Candidatus Schekmanbacteria bacterium]